MAENKDTQAAAPASPSSGKPLMIGVLIGAFSVGLGGVGAYFVVGPKLLQRQIEPPAVECAEVPADTATVLPGPMHQISGLVINPVDVPAGRRFLLLSVAFEVDGDEGKAALEAGDAILRDRLISHLSSKTVGELQSPTARDQMRSEITSVVQELFPKVAVRQVLFPQYVIN